MPQLPGAMSFDYAQDEVSLVMEYSPHPERSRRILPNPGIRTDCFSGRATIGNSMTIWIGVLAAAINGLLAVTAGAVASHLFAADPHRVALMSTGAQYAMYHALALIALAALAAREAGAVDRFLAAAAWLFLAGTVLFSGS